MTPHFTSARPEDINELLTLYRQVYGGSYALPLGTDPAVMAREISCAETTWLTAREPGSARIVGSIIGTVDRHQRLGKLQGLAIHPDARGTGLARQAVHQLSELLLGKEGAADSIYGTARTTSTAPQRICLSAGFRALGIFPNLHKAERHETMVLLAKHRPGVLERRLPVPAIPAELEPLVNALHNSVGLPEQKLPPVTEPPPPSPTDRTHRRPRDMELVDAPHFALRRFTETIPDPCQRFYPFHTPNVLLSAVDGTLEVYAQLNRSDGYCALIAATEPQLTDLAEDFESVITTLAAHGASHLEALLPLDRYQDLRLLLARGFLPAAAYPAMRRQGEGWRDYVVMARSLQPLDFRGLSIDAAFQPFTEQYIELWKQHYLNTQEVFH